MIRSRPLLVLLIVLLAGAFLLPVLTHAPNRLVSGKSIRLWDLGGNGLWLLPALPLFVGPFLQQTRRNAIGLLAAAVLFLAGLVFAAGSEASLLAATSAPAARTSFGSGFWVMLLAAGLMLAELMPVAGTRPAWRALLGSAAIAPIVFQLLSGHLGDLSILREYANKADLFADAVLRHMVIVVGALIPTVIIGVPLGILAHRRAALGQSMITVLNIVQTIPSIALFGLLMAPLSALAVVIPALQALGISGIGLAPAIIALTLYSILPIVRNTAEGLAQVPAGIIEAATGMGLTQSQRFWQIEAPLALPVFLSGLRVTVVQAIGLAAVAALIGAGGLGSIMFQGLFANALDLVLLGAVPIIALALAADAIFKLITDLLRKTA
jgi:osmoprotectant transport system permease protein